MKDNIIEIETGNRKLVDVFTLILKKMFENSKVVDPKTHKKKPRSKYEDKCTTQRLRQKKKKEMKSQGINQALISDQVRRIDISKYIIYTTCTLNTYKSNLRHFCMYIKDTYGTEYMTINEAKKHIQEYIYSLENKGLKPSTIHNYLAAVCKVTGCYMFDFEHPQRHAVSIKDDPTKYDTKTAATALRTAYATALRYRELKHLEPKDIQFNNDGTAYINSVGKGKKRNRTWVVFADDVEFLLDMVKIATSNNQKFLLTKKQIFAKGAYHYRRALAAQREYFALIDDFEKNPEHREKCKVLIYDEFERCERTCNENLDRTYHTRGYTRQMAEKIGKPTSYDRVALMFVSLFTLHHYRTGVTVQNYLIKR